MTHDHHTLAFEVLGVGFIAIGANPSSEPLVFNELRQAAVHREHDRHHPVGHRRVMNSHRPADHDSPRRHRHEPVDAGAERLDHPQARQRPKELGQTVRELRAGDKHLHIWLWLRDELHSFRQRAELAAQRRVGNENFQPGHAGQPDDP